MNKDSIAFDLGTNFDYKLFDTIKKYDTKHSITSIYGKIKRDGMPGGRASSIVPDITVDQLADYVNECKKNDIAFNYLINPLAIDYNIMDPVEGKAIREFIHTAYDIGIREFTVNSPMLVKYMKNNFDDIFITLGLYAYATNFQHIEYWRSWGVDEITLDHSFNRKFDLLRKILTQYKDTDLHLRVIANNLCLRECPYKLAHGCYVGMADPDAISMDYSLINCAYRKVTAPTAILTSEWIRPEDVHYYRELAEETGNKHFSLKLVDRTRTTEYLERVIKAYMEESFDGNLLDILNWPETKNMATVSPDAAQKLKEQLTAGGPPMGMAAGGPPMGMPASGPPMGMPAGGPPMGMPAGGPPMGMPAGGPPPGAPRLRYMDKLKPESMIKYGRSMTFPHVYVDNKKLDGFLEHFIKNNNCANTVCAFNIAEKDLDMPNVCRHCAGWAEKAVTTNKEEIAQWTAIAKDVLKNLEDGTIYK